MQKTWYIKCRGGNLPPATFRIQPVGVNGTTQCSGGNLPPTGPQGRNRGTFVSASSNGASPSPGLEWRWVNAATLFRVWGDTIQPHRLYMPRGGRQVAAPTGPISGGTVQPHRLYMPRGGRQVAAPTGPISGGTIHPHKLYSIRGILFAYLSPYCVKKFSGSTPKRGASAFLELTSAPHWIPGGLRRPLAS